MKKNDRAALAEAIIRRNAAAKAADVAREAFEAIAGAETTYPGDGRMGEKHVELKNARYDAEDRVAEIEKQQEQLLTTYMGDRVRMHAFYMREHDGKSADEVLDEARHNLDAAQKAEAAMVAAKTKPDLVLTDAELALSDAKAALDFAVISVLEKQAADMAPGLAEDMRAILGKVGAMAYLLRGSNQQQCRGDHPLRQAHDLLRWLNSIGQNTGVIEERTALEAMHRDGMLPWIAAANRLAIDANAPMPTDPTTIVPMKRAG